MSEAAANSSEAHISAQDVVELYDLFEQHGIRVWIDGGWGVDALLGEQTRPHGDLDIALEIRQLAALEELLNERGYEKKGEPEARPWNYVLRDKTGHEVDLHAFTFDEHGEGVLGPAENGAVYPAHALTGVGSIGERQVRCIAVEDVIRFHAGFEPRAHDFKDVYALCERFGLEAPEKYRHNRQTAELEKDGREHRSKS
jgi:lincosamide nucleotidyltransferase A/C/D/E